MSDDSLFGSSVDEDGSAEDPESGAGANGRAGRGGWGGGTSLALAKKVVTRAMKGPPVESSTTLAKLRGNVTSGRAPTASAAPNNFSRSAASSRPPASGRPNKRPVKVFVEIDHEVHVLRVSLLPIESVEDLHDAVMAACVESGAPELRDIDFKLDDELSLQYLDENDTARTVDDDTPIGLLKCARAMRAFRKQA